MRLLTGILMILQGCGGGADADPDPVDAPPLDAVCPLPAGRAYVLTHLAVLPGGEGMDLDGDGAADNELGNLPDDIRLSVNDGIAETIEFGTFLAGALITDWTDPPTPDDPEIGFHMLHILDEDRPN